MVPLVSGPRSFRRGTPVLVLVREEQEEVLVPSNQDWDMVSLARTPYPSPKTRSGYPPATWRDTLRTGYSAECLLHLHARGLSCYLNNFSFSVKRIRFKRNEFVADQLFCANGDQHILADANGDG